jgi:uncharacterized protein (DUF1697 family)
MRWVVFLRAANVGKNNRFQPAQLVKNLAGLEMVNVGAVGTFVVRKNVTEQKLRAALARELKFKCEIMICPAKTIIDLARDNPLARLISDDIEGFATILAAEPARTSFPICVPDDKNWQVKLVQLKGLAVLSLRRKIPGGRFYPNEVIEKKLGVPGTTRNWNTIEKVLKILESSTAA